MAMCTFVYSPNAHLWVRLTFRESLQESGKRRIDVILTWFRPIVLTTKYTHFFCTSKSLWQFLVFILHSITGKMSFNIRIVIFVHRMKFRNYMDQSVKQCDQMNFIIIKLNWTKHNMWWSKPPGTIEIYWIHSQFIQDNMLSVSIRFSIYRQHSYHITTIRYGHISKYLRNCKQMGPASHESRLRLRVISPKNVRCDFWWLIRHGDHTSWTHRSRVPPDMGIDKDFITNVVYLYTSDYECDFQV